MLTIQIPPRVKNFVQREFQGESLVWAHKCPPRHAVYGALIIWLFAVPWTAFSLFWETMAVHQYLSAKKPGMSGIIMVLWGVPFVAIGLAMMSAPYWAWRQAKTSLWIMSGKRLAYVSECWRAMKIRSVFPEDILQIERREYDDGSGTLRLDYAPTRDGDGNQVKRTDLITGIANVREVENMIRSLKTARV